MNGKDKSKARELVKKYSEIQVGDQFIENSSEDTHRIVALAIYEKDKPLVIHMKLHDPTYVLEATHIDEFFRDYAINSRRFKNDGAKQRSKYTRGNG